MSPLPGRVLTYIANHSNAVLVMLSMHTSDNKDDDEEETRAGSLHGQHSPTGSDHAATADKATISSRSTPAPFLASAT
jgi:hypothetical protein